MSEIHGDHGFVFLDHKADVYVMAFGRSLNECFEYAAKAMFEVMTDTSRIEPSIRREIHVNGFDIYSLLYSWLEELLYLFDAEGLVFSSFNVQRISKIDEENYVLDAIVFGEKFDSAKHERRTVVKAITYSQMEIYNEDNKFVAKFLLDI
ncbi:MAG: archease [archaeon YNP-WB-062]|jgi:SHS2 domain-containing protein|nr:archease [Candidatus Culexarchaeum yellowstonense]